MNTNLVFVTILFAIVYLLVTSAVVPTELLMALASTTSILTVIMFLRTKPLKY